MSQVAISWPSMSTLVGVTTWMANKSVVLAGVVTDSWSSKR